MLLLGGKSGLDRTDAPCRPSSGLDRTGAPAGGPGPASQDAPELWSSRAEVVAGQREVLAALTDPELIAAWAPVGFELECSDGCPLRTGSRERVSGSLAGVKATFDVEVVHAEPGLLELIAEGPLAMDVAYRFREQGDRVVLLASVGLRRRSGLTAQILRGAVAALLNAGALDRALARLAEVVPDSGHELAAA
jgi:hypothetical protein